MALILPIFKIRLIRVQIIIIALPAARAFRYNSSFHNADRSVAPFRGFHCNR
jgi:hypothetical protein